MKKSVGLIVYYFAEFNTRAPPSSLASLASVLVVMVLSKYSMAGFTRSSRTVIETAFKQEEIELSKTIYNINNKSQNHKQTKKTRIIAKA